MSGVPNRCCGVMFYTLGDYYEENIICLMTLHCVFDYMSPVEFTRDNGGFLV